MKKTVLVLLIFPVFFLSSCVTNPFPKVQLVDISGMDPNVVTKQFEDKITKNFEALQSFTIHFFGKEMTGLGYLSVNDETQSFSLTCMTLMGVRLLTIQKDPNGLKTEYSFSGEDNQPEILTEIAKDINRIYFDWTPSPTAALKRSRCKFTFNQKNSEGGKTRFVFGGSNANLIEKQVMDKGSRVVIQYYNYLNSPQAFYPQGIFLSNKKYHYKLIIRTKEFHVD
ncbi:MAG: DUF3261 domain-containing protein [Sedimentisphaerales bacterium]|nr:DUF3261 domain-containing protein [Sedimentisphaerales bacterium]